MLIAAQSGATTDPVLTNINMAQMANRLHGGPVVAAWEIDQLPDDWLDAIVATSVELPEYERGFAKVEKHKVAWRAKHPTYRKHVRH